MPFGDLGDLVVDPIQFVDADGHEVGTTRMLPVMADDEALRLHRLLVVTRALDQEFVRLQRQGALGVYAPCAGQEGAQVGTAAALAPTDWIVPSYRELGCAVVRGITPAEMVPTWRGTWFTDIDVRRHRFLPISVPVGTSGLHAAGIALGLKLDGANGDPSGTDAVDGASEPAVVATYFGDGATSEGDVHEAFNVASVFHVPCIFVIQNNGWAISTPSRRQYAGPTLAHRSIGYGMPGWRVDGNDVLACWWTMGQAVARARAGGGPVLLELLTYRMGPHTTSDDPSRYRSAGDEAFWAKTDPIARYRTFLERRGVLTAERAAEHAAAAAGAADSLRAAALAAADPSPLEVFDHVYASAPPSFAAQRAQMTAELAAWRDAEVKP